MYDYSLDGILNEIAGLTTFSLIYIIGGGFLFGAIAGFYWGIRKAIMVGAIATVVFFLFMSFREVGLSVDLLDTLFSYFQGILYMFVGVVFGAILSQMVFNAGR